MRPQSLSNGLESAQKDTNLRLESAKSNDTVNSDGIRATNQNGEKTVIKLQDIIKVKEVGQATVARIIDLTTRTEDRIRFETQILTSLKCFFNGRDSKLEVSAFGSSTYGFGGSKTNFNVLINTGLNSEGIAF